MDSNENSMTSKNNKAFSIRDYVLEAREKNIRNNWPFDVKYMDFLVKHGIDKLLPPFESPDTVRYSLLRCVQSQYAEEPDAHIDSNENCNMGTKQKNELIKFDSTLSIDEEVSDITRQMSPLSLSVNKSEHDDGGSAMPSTKCFSKKHKKRKGKHKMRSMADIYAEARPCTLEDCTISNGSTSAAFATMMPNVCSPGASESEKHVHNDINGSMTTSDHGYKHNPEGLKIANSIGGSSKGNGSFFNENEHLIKFKLSGCKSKTHNRKAVS